MLLVVLVVVVTVVVVLGHAAGQRSGMQNRFGCDRQSKSLEQMVALQLSLTDIQHVWQPGSVVVVVVTVVVVGSVVVVGGGVPLTAGAHTRATLNFDSVRVPN